ncbi:MAG: YggU family protein [Phycisphaerae bacterium]|nr:YggU family protein [Phycisphaerae bacterium]
MLNLTKTNEGILIELKVVPGASRDRIVGDHGGALKVTVAAPPEKGKANKAIVRLLAKALALRSNQVEVIRGTTSANKAILIKGSTEQAIHRLA